MVQEEQHTDRTGFLEALFCHVIWGLMPIYWKLVSGVPAFQVLAWRMVWAAVFILALCVLVKRVKFLYLAHEGRALRTFFASGLIVSLNWGIYVWAVNSGHVLETSIGYYLCPLANIFCGIGILALGFAFPAIWQLTPAMPSAMAATDPAVVAALLAGAGVLTAVPLLLFSAAANRVSMTILGFMQYIGPTLALVAAVFLFGEEFTLAHAVCFGLVWLGIAIVSLEPFVRKAKRAASGSAK